jgi:hypothetical protein
MEINIHGHHWLVDLKYAVNKICAEVFFLLFSKENLVLKGSRKFFIKVSLMQTFLAQPKWCSD